MCFFFSSRRRHTRFSRDWSSDVCSSDLAAFADDLGTVRVGVRVTARSLWHITLAFLGEVPEDRLPRAIAAVDRAVEGGRTGTGSPPPVALPHSLRLAGSGRFGRGKFTILWPG